MNYPRFKQCLLPLLLLAFVACKKNNGDDAPADDTLSSKDPKALSAAVKVWHGTRAAGALPAASGTSLVLDGSANPQIYAFAGRYAIIEPEIISGDVSGYYISLNGSSEHFKIDYTKPRNTGRKPGTRNYLPLALSRHNNSGGNADSAIVIALPANLHVPDTFCFTYSAYDLAGNVSAPVTTCIIVNSVGGDASSGWMNANWKLTAGWEPGSPADTIIFNKWISNSYSKYYCHYDSSGSYLDYMDNGTTPVGSDSSYYRKLHISFASSGGMQHEVDEDYKYVNYYSSTCQSLVYYPKETYKETISGAYSYNSTTKKLIMVFEFDEYGQPMMEAWEFDVIKVNDNHMIIVDNWDPAYPYYNRLEK